MCSFQQASYSIVISSYRSGTVVAKAITTRAYLKGDPITIPLMFKPQMAEDTEYNVILVVSSFGTDLQALTSFSTFHDYITFPLLVSDHYILF